MVMDMRMKTVLAAAFLLSATGCVSHTTVQRLDDVAINLTLDDPVNPSRVRFDVPTAALLGNPGDDRIPGTLRARIATRQLAARELATRGFCPHGFSGPDGIQFPEGNRAHSTFVVRCNA